MALLLQRSNLLSKKFRELMGRKSVRKNSAVEELRLERAVRKVDVTTTEVGLSTAYTAEEQSEVVLKVPAPICNLNSEAERGHFRCSKAATPEPVRSRREAPAVSGFDSAILRRQGVSGVYIRRNCAFANSRKGNNSVVLTPPKTSSPLRMKWLVRPLSTHMRRYTRSKAKLHEAKAPLSEANRRLFSPPSPSVK